MLVVLASTVVDMQPLLPVLDVILVAVRLQLIELVELDSVIVNTRPP